MKIVTAAEMREIDRLTTEKYMVSSLALMERAGAAVADFVLEHYPKAEEIGVICGKGNNGGDGFVAARKLYDAGKNVLVLLLADPKELKGDAAAMFEKLPVAAVCARDEKELEHESAMLVANADVLVDAIFGTGFRPPLTPFHTKACELINGTRPVVSVDIPSGIDADETEMKNIRKAIWAFSNGVVTFTAPKPAHIFLNLTSDPVVVAQIGTPRDVVQSKLKLEVITSNDLYTLRVPRPWDAHKGLFGHVLIVGGSTGKAGAAAMAAMASMRSGAGLTTAATPKSVLPQVAGFTPELMTTPLAENSAGAMAISSDEKALKAILEGKTVVAIGPGVSREPEAAQSVHAIVTRTKVPTVIDADGLNAFEGKAQLLNGAERPLVLTPHPKEMSRLTGLPVENIESNRVEIARKFAAEHNLILVLKGQRTLVAEPGGIVWLNVTGNPGMAKGGSGDVLTGIIAGFIAQSPDHLLNAVLAAVYVHGLSGDLAAEERGERSVLAGDLIQQISHAIRAAGEFDNRRVQLTHGRTWKKR
jgi:NAD(P)H-hydrate epimerase